MYKILDNKVWMYFVKYPSMKVHVRELARQLKISPTTALGQAKALEQKGLLKSERVGRNLSFFPDYDGIFAFYKRWTNLFLLISSGIVESLGEQGISSAILFGSFARGDDTERSDIDIAVDKEVSVNLPKFEKILARKIQIHTLTEVTNLRLKDNIRQGILLYGVMIS